MRVAAFQRFPIFDAVHDASDALLRDLLWADERGIDLAVFPECFLQGHSYDQSTVAARAISLHQLPLLRLLDRLTAVRTTAVVGLFERRGEKIYNSAIVFQRGHLMGTYAKAHPIEDGCTPGREFPVWSCENWTFGINICNDLNYPDVADLITGRGARLICCLLNMMLRPKKAERWRGPALENLQKCALRTNCFVVSADVAGPRDDGWLSYGCTAIVRPDGTIADRAAELVEDVAIFDLP